jgi:hypothetical protein
MSLGADVFVPATAVAAVRRRRRRDQDGAVLALAVLHQMSAYDASYIACSRVSAADRFAGPQAC